MGLQQEEARLAMWATGTRVLEPPSAVHPAEYPSRKLVRKQNRDWIPGNPIWDAGLH